MAGVRNYPLLIGAGVALLISGLVGAAAITGILPAQGRALPPPALENTAAAAAARKASCRTCGVIAAVRKVEAEVEKETRNRTLYRVTVRMDGGGERTVTQQRAPAYAVGERVRLNGNALERG